MSRWLPLEITEKQAMAMVRAVDHFIACHNECADCHPSNHPKYELDAIGLVGFKIGDAINRAKYRSGVTPVLSCRDASRLLEGQPHD